MARPALLLALGALQGTLAACASLTNTAFRQQAWPGRQHQEQRREATIAEVHEAIRQESRDVATLTALCRKLGNIAEEGRGEQAPFAGRRIALKHLTAGIGEAYATGTLNCLRSGAPDKEVQACAQSCLDGAWGVAVNYDHDLGLALYQNSPHLWEAFVTFVKRYRSDPQVLGQINMAAGLYGSSTPEPGEGLAAAGGFGLAFEIMDQNYTDGRVFQAALAALSDNVQGSRRGAELVANEGGPANGIKVLLRAMERARGQNFHDTFGYGLQYEVVHDTNGLLWHDDAEHTWRNAFYSQGYLDLLMSLMPQDHADNRLQDNCCQAIHYMTKDGGEIQEKLAGLGAIGMMAAALKRFAPQKIEGYCTVIHSCSTALLNFARARPEWLAEMRKLGVEQALSGDVLLYGTSTDSGTPGWENFPSANMISLKKLLKG